MASVSVGAVGPFLQSRVWKTHWQWEQGAESAHQLGAPLSVDCKDRPQTRLSARVHLTWGEEGLPLRFLSPRVLRRIGS